MWYVIVTQLTSNPKKVQAATFMTIIGVYAIQIFNTSNLSTDEYEDLSKMKKKCHS